MRSKMLTVLNSEELDAVANSPEDIAAWGTVLKIADTLKE